MGDFADEIMEWNCFGIKATNTPHRQISTDAH